MVFQQPSTVWVNPPRTLFPSEPLFGDLVAYIAGTMDEGNALCLTSCEEANPVLTPSQASINLRLSSKSVAILMLNLKGPHSETLGSGVNLKFSAPPLRSRRLRGECI